MPQRTVAEALEVIQLVEARLAALPPGSPDHQRLSTTIIQLQQVVSMLSDAAHQTPDAVLRGRNAVAQARREIAEVGDVSTNA